MYANIDKQSVIMRSGEEERLGGPSSLDNSFQIRPMSAKKAGIANAGI
jgi:hypothetical protein